MFTVNPKRIVIPFVFILIGIIASLPVSADGAACFSPDGAYVLTGDTFVDGMPSGSDLRLWETKTGELIRVFQGHTEQAMTVCFSPDGRYILSGSGGVDWSAEMPMMVGETKLWDAASGEELATFDTGSTTSVGFSPDGKQALTASHITNSDGRESHIIQIWDVPGGNRIRQFKDFEGVINTVSFSPEGSHILFGGSLYDMATGESRGVLRKINVETGEEVIVFKGHSGTVCSAEFSRDGRYILSASAFYPGDVYYMIGEAILWEAASGRIVQEISCGPAFKATLSSDGKRALAGGAMWDLTNGSRIFESGLGSIFSPDDKYILSSFIEYNMMEGMYYKEQNKLWQSSTGELILTFE